MKRVILLILALVLTLSLMACRSKEPEDAADAADNNTLSNSAPLTFRRDEDGWKWVDDEEFPLDASYVEEILTALDAMSVSLAPVTPAVDPADSGLDEPDRYTTVTVGEDITTLRFGDQQDDGQWYMAIDGQEDTYLVADEFVKLMDRSIYDMAVLPTLPELTDDNLTVITVRQTEGDKTVRLSKTDSGWVNGGKALPDGIADIEAALADFTFDKCFNYNPSPDAAPLCGLDVPTATITLSYVNTVGTESSVVLTLGTLREDGAYYATLNDDTTVYLLSQDKIAPLLALL